MMRQDTGCARGMPRVGATVALGAFAVVLLVAAGSAAHEVPCRGTWGDPIDPEALQILKGMTDYLGSLQQFTMHTENTFDDVLETGQKIQFGFSANVVVQRPNKMRAERTEGMARMLYLYDGATFSMFDAGEGFFATVDVPGSIDEFLHFARDALDLVPPAGDMVFADAFELLTAGINSGFVVGETMVGGVPCIHLAFTTPVVDWQVWIAEGDRPLPYKYVLTTRDDPAQPQFVTVISKWDTDPKLEDGTFRFNPPPGTIEIDFIRADAARSSAR